MSDESTVTATSLLAALMPKIEATTRSTETLAGDEDMSLTGTFSRTLQSVLASNFGADVDSNSGADSPHIGKELEIGLSKSSDADSLSTSPPTLFENLPFQAYEISAPNLSADSGKGLTSNGEFLPIRKSDHDFADFETEIISPELDAVDIRQKLTTQISGASISENVETVLSEDSETPVEANSLTTGLLLPPEAAGIPSVLSSSPITAPENSQPPLTTASSVGSVSNTSHFSGADTSSTNTETDFQNGSPGDSDLPKDGAGDELPELVATERATAKFSLDNDLSTEQFQHRTSTVPTADRGSSSLNSFSQFSSSGLVNSGSLATNNLPAQPFGLSPSQLQSQSPASFTERNNARSQIVQQLTNFISKGDNYAEINLSPPYLGKISVRISLQNDQASVLLSAPSPEIRELIEGSLPKLSALLSEAGLALADTQVSDQSLNGDSFSGNKESADEIRRWSDEADNTQQSPDIGRRHHTVSLLDAYA